MLHIVSDLWFHRFLFPRTERMKKAVVIDERKTSSIQQQDVPNKYWEDLNNVRLLHQISRQIKKRYNREHVNNCHFTLAFFLKGTLSSKSFAASTPRPLFLFCMCLPALSGWLVPGSDFFTGFSTFVALCPVSSPLTDPDSKILILTQNE